MRDAHAQSQVRPAFFRSFSKVAQRVHRQRALGLALTYAGFGLALGGLGALVLWALRRGELRPFVTAFGLLGALFGVWHAKRRRWSESEVALYLDARLESQETLTTALGAEHKGDPASAYVVERAAHVLARADASLVKPPLWSPTHLALPAAAAAIAVVCLLPLPPAPKPPPAAPGAERVRLEHLQGLERIEALAQLRGQNLEQDARLQQLAERARKLRQDLQQGLEKREALSEIAKLRDGIAAERLKFGDQNNRPGLDAALLAMKHDPALRDAERALGNGDLTAFDEEMQRLANRAESSDRQAAKEALQEAAKAAHDKGAHALGDALDAERRLFDRREAHAQALRELAQSLSGKLSPEALNDLKEFGRRGDAKTEQRLEQSLERALEGLTGEERKRLAERMQRELADSGGAAAPLTKRQLQDMAKSLSSDGGVEALKKQLRELADQDPSDDAKREQGLNDAERGGSDAERGLGGMPIPVTADGAPNGSPGHEPGSNSKHDANGKDGPEGAGAGHDTGSAEHHGSTPEIAGNSLRSKAEAHLQPGAPMQGATLGRAPARPGETANLLGTGTLGEARRAEVGAVDHADIPEEYREQVGRYFEP